MNGLEIFGAHPELWDFDFEKCGGAHGETIDNRTASEYATLWASMGMDASEEKVMAVTRAFCTPTTPREPCRAQSVLP